MSIRGIEWKKPVLVLWSAWILRASLLVAVSIPMGGAVTVHAFNSMDEIFFHEAVIEQMFILEAAKVAQLRIHKADDKRVKQYGHEVFKTVGHLNKLLEKLSIEKTPPGKRISLHTTLKEKQLKKMHKLEESPPAEFVPIFLETMIHAHESLVSIYEHELEYGSSTPVRNFAAEKLPVIKEHLHRARQMLSNSNPE